MVGVVPTIRVKHQMMRAHFGFGDDLPTEVSTYQLDFGNTELKTCCPSRKRYFTGSSAQVVPKITPETESNKWLSSTQSGLPWFDNTNRTYVYLQSKLAFKEIKHFQTDSVGMLKDNYHIPLVPRYFMDFRIPGVRCYEKPTQIIVEDTPDEHTKDKEKPKFPESPSNCGAISEVREAFQWPFPHKLRQPFIPSLTAH